MSNVSNNRPLVSRRGNKGTVHYDHPDMRKRGALPKKTEFTGTNVQVNSATVGVRNRHAAPTVVHLPLYRGGEFGRDRDAHMTPHLGLESLDVATRAMPAVDALAHLDVDTLPDVVQLCCEMNVPTQFPSRMWDCEGSRHDLAAAFVTMAGWAGYVNNPSLDGVVRLSYPSHSTLVESERVTLIRDDGGYISDHDGLNVDVSLRVAFGDARVSHPIEFNIVTQNLEGLCSKSKRYESTKAKLGPWFRPHVTRGTFLVAQELALQLNLGDAKQIAMLDRNFATLLQTLQSTNPDVRLVGETDGYTGGVIYDSLVWERLRVVVIRRAGSSKCSNAYLMRHREEPACCIWIVNIHLKAIDFQAPREYVNEIHVDELLNILISVLNHNHMKCPMYLCGDFNNPDSKYTLVTRALTALQKVAATLVVDDGR